MSVLGSQHALFPRWLRRLPHYLYLADLVADQRVLELGCGSGDGANFLANHGALRVIGIDPSTRAIEEARSRHRLSNLEFRREHLSAIELDDASFDVVFVPDGMDVLRRAAVLTEIRRVLTRDGHLILCATSADRPTAVGGASFYEFVERLEPLFAPVRMVAQSPFVAMSLVEYGDADSPRPDLALDTGLLGRQEALEVTDYIAVCGGRREVMARGMAVIQLPLETGIDSIAESIGRRQASTRGWEHDVEHTTPATPAAMEDPELPALRQELVDLKRRVVEADAAAQRSTRDLEAERRNWSQRVDLERERADQEMSGMRLRLAELEDELSARPAGDGPGYTEQIADALSSHGQVVASLEQAIEEGQAYIDELRDELMRARADAEAAERRYRTAEARVAELSEALKTWRTRASTAEGKLLAYESGARSAAPPASSEDLSRRVTELERELAEARNGRAPAESASAAAAMARAVEDASQKLAAVRDQLARTESERNELERKLRAAQSRPDPVAPHRSNAAATALADRLATVEAAVEAERELLRELEDGLAAIRRQTTEHGAEVAPSAWAVERERQLDELAGELGVKDAEVAILHIGVMSLRERIKQVVRELRDARAALDGRVPADVVEVLDGLTRRLSAYEEHDS